MHLPFPGCARAMKRERRRMGARQHAPCEEARIAQRQTVKKMRRESSPRYLAALLVQERHGG